jgi:hypothetical protein
MKVVFVVAALASMAGGCRGKEQPSAATTAPIPTAAKKPATVDQAGADELAEGPEKAFGLPIPRRMEITSRYSDEVFAAGPFSPEQLANYVRDRVVDAHVETGAVKTVFTDVKVKGGTTPLRIEVSSSAAGGSELFVKDMTRPQAPALSPADAWKAVGMTPDGQLADPTHLH